MKVTHQTHPTRDELATFLAGKLNAVDSDNVEQHLSECESCCQILNTLPNDDTVVSMLRQQEADTSVSPEMQPAIPETIVPETGHETRPPQGEPTQFAATGKADLQLPPELRDHPRYRIVELLGHGGMGDVYRAEHKVMNRRVALKVIKPQLVQNDAAVRRFRREVQAAARLRHPNIVTAFDAEQAGDLHYLVMEFVDGEDLDEVIRARGPLPVAEACDYIRQAAEGLQHANEQGMVHRDIKPHNLMIEVGQAASLPGSQAGRLRHGVDKLEAYPTLKILDFGLANFANEVAEDVCSDRIHAVDEPDESGHYEPVPGASILHQLTQMGTMMGTPDYIAPEQAEDAHTADIRSDIYSLGCTFYTLLTGKPPFGEGSVLDKIKAHTEKEAAPLSDTRDDVPAEVEAILNKMMAKDPAERYQTPAEVAAALASVAASFQLAKAEEKDRQAGSSSPRKRRPLVLTAVATLFLAILAAVVFYIQTNNGVVRVEVTDPSLKVSISGQTITMEDGGKPLTIRAGEQKLIVRQIDTDFELVTDSFQLRRGERVALKVELLPGEVVVRKDGERLSAKRLPESETESNEDTVVVSVTKTDSAPMIRLEGDVVKNQQELFDRLVVMAEKNRRLVVRLEGDLALYSKDFEELHKLLYQAGVLMVKLPPELQREARIIAENQVLWAKERLIRSNNLEEIGKALHNYHDANQQFPPARISDRAQGFDEQGRPLLSWRVHLLPYVSENGPELYNQFHLDEPWDSQHNIKLLDQMPEIYKTTQDPAKSAFQDPRKTTYLAVVGEGTAYEGKAGLKAADITTGDGLSNTAYIVDAGRERAVPWTQPEDLPFDKEDPIRAFGTSDFGDIFLALMADGAVKSIPYDTAPESLRALFTRAAGDTFDETAKRTTPLPSAESPVNELTPIGQLDGHRSWISDIVWHPDGARAVSINSEGVGALDPCVRMWNVAERKLVWEFKRGDYFVGSAVAISPDGGLVAVSPWGVKEHVLLLDADTGEEVRKLKMDFEGVITALDFSPKHDWLAAAARPDEGGMQVWNWKTGETVTLREGGASYDVRFTPDGGRLLTGGDSLVWRPTEGLPDHEKRADGQGSRSKGKTIRQIAVSPDGRLWATADSEGVVELLPCWNPAAAKFGRIRSCPPETYFAGVTLTFTPDSRHLISAGISGERADVKSAIGRLIIWDVETMKPVIETHRQNPYRTSLALSPDGRTLLTTGQPESNKINIWQLPESVWPEE